MGACVGWKERKKRERDKGVYMYTFNFYDDWSRETKKFFFNSWKFSFFFPITPKWVENEEVKTNEIPVS